MGNDLPAWPFLLAALAALGIAIWQLVAGNVVGWFPLALFVVLVAVAIRQGRRAMANATMDDATAQGAVGSGAGKPKEGGSALSAYYENEAAVRAIQKETRRLCKECGSPVLANASECPTCGSSV